MFQGRLIGLLLGACVVASPANAQERSGPIYEITFAQTLELARRQSPGAATARARVTEAEGQAEAAALWPFNPEVEAAAGPRFDHGGSTADWSVAARQWLEVGGQRGRRVAGAKAAIEAASARRENSERLLLRESGLAFVEILYWQRRAALARENRQIAEQIARTARRRHEVGDAGGLDEAVSALTLARAQTDEVRTEVEHGQAIGRLKIVLGLESDAQIIARGDLLDLGVSRGEAAAEIEERPDVRALKGASRQAEAEAALGRAARIPDVALGALYAREEDADIVQAALTLALPVFDHGQGTVAVAESRRARIETELDATRRRAAIEIETADTTARRLETAVHGFEEDALATIERTERIATASYEAGAIPLGELLVVRREIVEAKLDYANLLFSAAAARVELAASTGGLR